MNPHRLVLAVLTAVLGLVAVARAQLHTPAPQQIRWQRTLDDALALSLAEHRPLFIAINFDGESASDRIVTERYRDPQFVAWTRRFACVVASVSRHNPRDFDPQGRRIPCPRLGEVTCGEHVALETILFDRYLGGERVSPRHAAIQPDGTKSFDLFLLFDLTELDTELARCAASAPPPEEPPALPSALDKKQKKVRLEQWRKLAGAKHARGRAAFETLLHQTKNAAWTDEALDALTEVGDKGSIGALRILLSREPIPAAGLLGRVGNAAEALKVGPEIATIVRERLAELGPHPGWPALDKDRAFLPLLARFGGTDPTVKSFLLAHQAIGSEADTMAAGRALAPLLADEDVTRVAAAIEAAGGACQLPELFVFARDVGRTLPRAAKAAEMPLPTQELERELEASDVAVSADPKNPELAQRFGRASLELGKRYADAGGGNPGLLLEDARTWLARAATERPNDVKLAFDRAKAAYYLSRFEEQEKIALAAFGSFPPRDGLSTEALALVDPKTLGDGDVRRAATLLHAEDKLEALRWIGDAAARLAPTRAGGDPAAEVAGYLWGARSLALVAASPGASETDCISLASYLSLIGLAREATAAWELGANRWPESNDLRAGLNRALWAGGRLDLAPAKAAWIQGAHPDSGACAWHTAYAWMLVAEQERREQRNEAAIDAYERAGRLFAESITLRPDFETGATHYIAMAHLGTGFAQLARGQRGNALESLAAALERSASVLDVRDGLDREVPDLIDALLEWRDGRKSPLASGTVADALAAATPNSARTVAMVADAELREALRADGRSTVGVTLPSGEVERIPTAEGDEYMLGSIAAARRALAIEDNEATRHLLAQSLVVHAERWLERENTEHSAPLLAEGAGLLGVEPPAPAATLGALRESAEQMRALLGPGRPLFRPGR